MYFCCNTYFGDDSLRPDKISKKCISGGALAPMAPHDSGRGFGAPGKALCPYYQAFCQHDQRAYIDYGYIWIHIYEVFEAEGVTNVAWVWNTVNPLSFNYLDWYPGDEYVDWWGINYFTSGQINAGDSFLNDAKLRNKPVMICESCPIHDNGTLNTSNWDDWFVPYFEKIKDKITVY